MRLANRQGQAYAQHANAHPYISLVGSSPGLNLTVSLSALTWRDWLIRFAVKRRRVSEPQRNREADQRAQVCPQRVFPFSAALFHAARLWTVPGNL